MSNDSVSFKRYATQEELQTAHPGVDWSQYGPVQKYNGREFVQVYFGQDDWVAISLENPDDFHRVSEWNDAKEFGYIFVDADRHYLSRVYEEAKDWDVTPELQEF